jgi:hypothetical protein
MSDSGQVDPLACHELHLACFKYFNISVSGKLYLHSFLTSPLRRLCIVNDQRNLPEDLALLQLWETTHSSSVQLAFKDGLS